MKSIASCLLAATLLSVGSGVAMAQEATEGTTTPPPKVLLIDREFMKPGKSGAVHEKSESAFVQAYARAKWPTHYFALNSLTGKNRTLFLIGYDSFAAWEKDAMAQQMNSALSSATDRAALADGELLAETDAGVFTYNEEQSLRGPVDIARMRLMEIALYRVRPGHRHEWNELMKLVKAAYDKIPDTHWAMYEDMYGQEDATYLVVIPMKSASEIDKDMENDKQFAENMGADGMKRLSELESSAVEFTQTNLFSFNPAMSYPREDWVKEDPGFWKPKAAMHEKAMPKAKGEEKPAAKP
ncbi:MAG TPA: hypothetical protein VHV29_00875 [Terriglobales bacterium]|jgi:hypothetical protein|nr:hypothetical protein [Terriglobales bacterium]